MAANGKGSMAYEAERALRTIFRRCLECPNKMPSCPHCSDGKICSLVPRSCNSCAYMTCIQDPSPPPPSGGPNVGAIAGGVVGGVAFVAIIVYFVWRFWIKKRREQQDRELEEEWEKDDVAQQKGMHQFNAMATDAASTRTRGSLANSILSRASNIIQIAYIPGVTNRNGSTHNSLNSPPVPPIPAALRGSSTPKSPLSNDGDALFFRPGDLRDSTWSGTSSIRSDRRDTQYTMQSITPSLARASMVSEAYFDDATTTPMPSAQRPALRMVSIKSANSSDSSPGTTSSDSSSNEANSFNKKKGLQVMMPGQGPSPLRNGTGSLVKATQVTVGKGKGRFPVRSPGAALSNNAPAVSSPLSPHAEYDSDSDLDEHARAKESLLKSDEYLPPPQPADSPFFDATDQPGAAVVAASSNRPNPYASMASTIGASSGRLSPRRGSSKAIGGLSAVIEEATRRASRVPSHEGLGGKRDISPFSDEHATE